MYTCILVTFPKKSKILKNSKKTAQNVYIRAFWPGALSSKNSKIPPVHSEHVYMHFGDFSQKIIFFYQKFQKKMLQTLLYKHLSVGGDSLPSLEPQK